jgi:hypothetical protein
MLPVGEAETVGANINTNTERRVHKTEDTLGRFIAASVAVVGMRIYLIEPRMLQALRLLKQAELGLNRDIIRKRTCFTSLEQPSCQSGTGLQRGNPFG